MGCAKEVSRILFVGVVCLCQVALIASTVYEAHPNDVGSMCDCLSRATAPGDECRLHTGRYYVTERCNLTGIRGTASAPIIFAAAGDGPVIIDGTIEITAPFRRRGQFWAGQAVGICCFSCLLTRNCKFWPELRMHGGRTSPSFMRSTIGSEARRRACTMCQVARVSCGIRAAAKTRVCAVRGATLTILRAARLMRQGRWES
eukprot:m.475872 g.475872  ORF g.475872 m.475872 type:complete len:202 (+) comp39279_c0_seq1:36-641(+)